MTQASRRNPGARARAEVQILADPDRTVREIAAAAMCSAETVWVARRALAHNGPVGNDVFRQKLRAMPDDPHADRAMTDPANRAARLYSEPPDEIEDFCPGCTPEWAGGSWRHDRACVFAARQKA
jgi:hypothetical protein